jgi:HAD superfamily hydrolase (TIGR01509 family)
MDNAPKHELDEIPGQTPVDNRRTGGSVGGLPAVQHRGGRGASNRLAMWALLAGSVGGWVLTSGARRRRQVISYSRRARLGNLANLDAILIDVDGTLIDSNAAHAETWAQALREHGAACTVAQVRPLVGMGGDKLLRKVAAVEEDSTEGRAISKRKKALFAERLPGLAPTRGARGLIAYLRLMKKDVVVATSADDREMNALLQQAGVADLIPHRTSKDDASESKPDPDIVQAALERIGARAARTVMVGDTPYDVEAARRAGVETIALRSGGHWSDEDLDGAIAVLDNPAALLACWQRGSPAQAQRGISRGAP